MTEEKEKEKVTNAAIAALPPGSPRPKGLSIKISPSGTGVVCVYGLGRFPISLYYNQWVMLSDLIKSGEMDEWFVREAGTYTIKKA